GEMDPRPFEPTPHRRQLARQEGRFALSRDLSVVLVAASGLITLNVRWHEIADRWTSLVRDSLSSAAVTIPQTVTDWFPTVLRTTTTFLNAVLPVLLVPMALCVFLTFFQTGFHWNVSAVVPRPDRLWTGGGDEGRGPFSCFSVTRLTRCALAILYLIGMALVLGWTIPGILAVPEIAAEEPTLFLTPVNRSLTILLPVTGLIAMIDYALIRWRYESRLRMTHQELKEEQRELQGDPRTASRRQRLRSDLTRQEVESAARPGDLLLTSEDGSAVLVRYTPHSTHPPEVLSAVIGRRGTLLADRARIRGAVTVSQHELVKELIASVRPGERIPPALYRPIARLFAETDLGGKAAKG
ncbi:MAG: EscU/YscU/HrcU family type III secretion system export apparatus switch protein, partial [Planctomycetia bacterium]|nr:EscU/YscU/HrcU family type III secretion system export apparatus switch protein [Planctomycetia bacterium]